MEYKELLDLGFSRREYCDPVFENRYGFRPFEMIFVNSCITLSWYPLHVDEVIMYINNVRYKDLESLQDVVEVVQCFKNND